MAKPATTHVIEIESGIGEPAFIPLTLGQELQPISVGKKGMWRVEGARVLDVHAFVYFDGNALFLQSADEESAALVDGYRVGKAWTELHAPCRIEVGAARLRFRSLIGDPAQAATVAQVGPPVKAPPGGPGGGAPSAPHGAGSAPGQHGAPPPRTAPPPAAGRPPPQASAPAPANNPPTQPLSFPKPQRPFAPGELAAQNDDESTRIAPLESTGARAVAGKSGSINSIPPNSVPPRPAAGRPVEEDLSTRPEAARAAKPPGGSGPYPAQPPPLGMPPGMVVPSGSMPPGMVQGVMPVQSMPPGMMGPGGMPMQPGMPMQGMPSGSMPPGGMPPPGGYGYPQPGQSGGYPQQGYPPGQMGGSGAFGTMPSGQMQGGPGGPSVVPGGFGPGTPEPAKSEGLQSFSEVMKDPAQRKKLLAVGVILMGGVYLLLLDDDPPPPPRRPVAMADGGLLADGGAVAAGGTAGGPLVAPPAPCPAGFQPYGEVRAGAPVTCVPAPAGDPGSSGAVAGSSGVIGGSSTGGGTAGQTGPTDAGSAVAAVDAGKPKVVTSTQQKTLERQAVDYVAIGEYQKAIGIYEQLSRQFPDNKVYSEALRILRQKLDAGVQ